MGPRQDYRAEPGQPYRLVLTNLGGGSVDVVVETDQKRPSLHMLRMEMTTGDDVRVHGTELLLVPLVDIGGNIERRGRIRLEQVGTWVEAAVVLPELSAADLDTVESELLRGAVAAARYPADKLSWQAVADALPVESVARRTIEDTLNG